MHRISLALVVFLLASCAQPAPKRAPGTYLSPAEIAACEAKGGRTVMARYTLQVCAVPTTDAGAPCNDKADCQGFCEAPWGAQPDAVVTGTCSMEAQDVSTGCSNHVLKGKATGEWCFH